MDVFNLMESEFIDNEGGSGLKSNVEFMWGGNGLNKDNIPAWNVSYKGNVTFDSDFSNNFHLPTYQVF